MRAPVVAAALIVMLAACGSPGDAGPTASETRGGAGDRPVLDGLFTVEWGRPVSHVGVDVGTIVKPGERNAFAFRSACRGQDRCVVTGGGVADPSDMTAPLAALRVGDYVDGHWTIVWRSESGQSCTGADNETHSSPVWTYFDIADDLTMTTTLVGTGDCPFIETYRPILSKADGDLHGVPVPDPAEQPARAVPVGAGFTGDYALSRKPRDGGVEQTSSRAVTTRCLRTEPRCVSTSVNDEALQFSVLEFSGDAFSRHAAGVKSPCADGGDGVAEVTETLRPDVGPAPLRRLAGERVTAFSSGCPGTITEDVTYTLSND